MKKLLQELADSGKVLVSGSYAMGTQTNESDIDFFVKIPKECVLYGGLNSNIAWIIQLLEKYGIKWNSTRTSYLSTIGEENDIPIQIEFYDGFYRNKKKLPEVIIEGVTFKTH